MPSPYSHSAPRRSQDNRLHGVRHHDHAAGLPTAAAPYSRTIYAAGMRSARAGARSVPTNMRLGRKSSRATALIALASVAVLLLGALTLCQPFPATNQTARSTPISQWSKGDVPQLYQIDPAWSQEPYAGATVGTNGCGPTCLTMVYAALTGSTEFDPASMAAFSDRNGFTSNGLTEWRLMTEGASLLGLRGEELPASEGTLAAALSSGMPVIASMLPGDFTTVGHFIVLAGLDADGRAIVCDPNSPERSARTWELGTILSQAANLWGFSVA